MKNLMFCAVLTAITTVVIADPSAKNPKDMTKAERQARKAEAIMKRYGGFVIDRSSQRGVFQYVNVQKDVPTADFASEVEQLGKLMKIDMRIVESTESVTPSTMADVRKKLGANAAVFLIADDSLPPLLISPEYNCGLINVKALTKGATDREKIRKRMSCEIWRSFAFLCQGYSPDVRSAMQEVKDVSEFDDFAGVQFGPETMMSAPRHLRAIGICPYEVTTYRALCTTGRAPSPTNEFQKAIWNEIHQLPTKPLTIKYDAKKGE